MTPDQIWTRAKLDEVGIAFKCDSTLEQQLLDYRKGKDELFGFYIFRRGEEVWIVKAKNLSVVRTDGDYAPMED